VNPALPVLVTRLPDRRALAQLLRAALRHEVVRVALTEAPRPGTHTLDLRVTGSPSVSVLAETAGAPHDGHFPLLLRPLHRAHAAELYALLEAELLTPDRSGPGAVLAIGRDAPRALPHEDSGPILRAMSGSAPPPAAGLALRGSVTAAMSPRPPGHLEGSQAAAPADEGDHGAAADDPSLSVSVVFEPDMLPAAVSAATAAAIAAAKGLEAEEPLPADGEAPSLSVSVIFEPGVLAERLASSAAGNGDDAPPSADGPFATLLLAAPVVAGADLVRAGATSLALSLDGDVATAATPFAAGGGDSFFDEDLANLTMAPGAPDEDPSVVVPPPPGVAPPSAPPDAHGEEPFDDEDATLIRLPGVPSKGAPPSRSSVRAPAREDLTPTANDALVQKRSPTGRKKRTTRSGKTTGSSKKKPTRGGGAVHAGPQAAFSSVEATIDAPSKREVELDDGADPLIGRRIADGKYAIEAAIGSGAAGAVYKALHRELRRSVAIKVLHPHYQQDPHFMKSFRGEALAASQLDHPNVMRVLDFGQEADGLVYIVMEFLSGRTLQSLLDEERRLQTERAAEIMIQVCAALSVAHDNGIIHRDIKPDNIMLVSSRNDEGAAFELVKVCDFGIAALQNPTREEADLGLADNVIAGTPEYMSPEQACGSEIDARSDVYACGICLYELVTGRPPFIGDNPAEILIKQLEELPRPPSQVLRGLDPIVEEIILRAIQKDPKKRQQSARELRVELKEVIDPVDAGGPHDDDERSIVESVPVLDDPASGFPGFFLALSSAILRFGRFERGHPEAAQAMKELGRATKAALRGRRELTFARRDSPKQVGFCVMTGHGEIVELRRLLGSQLYGSFGEPFVEALMKRGIAAMTLREGLPDTELHYLIEMLLGPHAHEDLRKELLSKPLRHLSLLFVTDVLGRDRKLSWKVGLCAARLGRDLRALSNVRGISLKKMREIREGLVTGVAHLLTRGDEVRQFLFNADLIDESVANLRGFSGFKVAPLVFERLLHEPCAEAVTLLLADFDKGEFDAEILTGYLRAFATRLLGERSPKSDAAVAELYRRSIVTDEDVPRDLHEQIRAQSLAEALVRDPSQFLRTLDFIQNADDYERELATLEAAMAVLARRAEAPALLAAISVLARHAKGNGRPGERERHALRTMKSMIDKQRLVPIARAVITGPPHQREAAAQLLVLAGSAGAHALYTAREGLADPSARVQWVTMFRATGPAGWALLSTVLPRVEVHSEMDIAFVEDLLRAMPDRQDHALGDAVAKFLAHPRLRPAALAAIAPLWGERARKPLMDALEFAEEPARVVAITELRRIRALDEQMVNVIERLLTMKGSAGEELRTAAAAALADVPQGLRSRAAAFLSKGIEGKRGLVAMLRGDGTNEESVAVTEAMARSLLNLDRAEGLRVIRARLAKSDPSLRARLAALL
jgi:serine/threonine protein kinase